MAFSKIVLTFNRRVEINEYVTFSWRDLDVNGGATPYLTNEEWALARTRPGLVEYNLELNNGELDALNYIDSFNYDFNGGNLFVVSITAPKEVTIQAKKSNIEFFDYSSIGGVTAVITNEPQVPTFQIDSITYEEAATDKCTNVQVRVTCTDAPTSLINPVVPFTIAGNDILFDYVRGTNTLAIVTNGIDSPQSSFTTPPFVIEPTVSVVNTPTGATATISAQPTISLEYSLDQITWQSSTVFTGLASGNFTVYARDSYGCIKSTAFVVDDFTPDVTVTEPTAFVSNTNSLRFKKDEVWNNNSIFRNDYNTLSYEEKASLVIPFIHKFTDQDVVETQFKTNYASQEVEIYNCTDDTTDLATVVQITDNLNKVDKRDAIGYEFTDGSGRYGFYFQTGNLYEDDWPVNTISGTYQLFGGLPAWATIGTYFSVDNGAYAKVDDIVFVDEIQSYVVVSNISYAGQGSVFILRAQYNVFNWDAFEFDIDMSLYLNKEIQVTINLTDPDFQSVSFKSEKIQVYSDLSDRVFIRAYNKSNNEIVYSEGIQNFGRFDYDLYGLRDESELEIEKGDQRVYKLEGYSYPKKELMLTRMTTMIARKIRQMLTLDVVQIDGIDCVIEEIGEPERIGITNQYKFTVTLYEITDRFDEAEVDTDIDLDIQDVPGLVANDDEFIKYE